MERTEWLAWRHKGLGSSDSPVVMGVSPWKTPFQLWEEKTKSDFKEDNSNSYIKNKGNVIEGKIRAQVEILHGTSYDPCMLQDSDFEFLKATLDGRSADKKSFVEIKLLGAEDFELVKQGTVPQKYYPQVMHQAMVSQCEKCYLAAYLFDSKNPNVYDSTRLLIIEVPIDKDYCNILLESEVKFWDCVVTKRPPMLTHKDYKQLRGAAKLINRWKKLKEQIEKLSEQQDELRKEILLIAELDGHPRLHCGGVSLIKVATQGSVDYKKLLKDKGITEEEADTYRKNGRLSWKFDLIEKKGEIQ